MIPEPKKRGRPSNPLKLHRVAVTLDPETVAKGRRLGGNSLSNGIRIAIRRAKLAS